MNKKVALLAIVVAMRCSAETGFNDPRMICAQLKNIEHLPMKVNMQSEDIAFNLLRTNRAKVRDCLIDKISDTTPMPDPTGSPIRARNFVVGDLALFLLSDFGYVEFQSTMPRPVQKRYEEVGVAAYFEFVEAGKRSRLEIQAIVRKIAAREPSKIVLQPIDPVE